MDAKDHMAIAKILYAMEMKRKKPDARNLMLDERYQRTMTDEYPFRKPPRAGFKRVPEAQKRDWRMLALFKW